jgi:hypothetical protein
MAAVSRPAKRTQNAQIQSFGRSPRRGGHLLGVLVLVCRGAYPGRAAGGGAAGVLAAAGIEEFTRTTTFQIMQSVRLDRGHTVSIPVQP